ncbi:MAG: hypothetical protein ACQETD_02800 [Pseudomonadota bacterium]
MSCNECAFQDGQHTRRIPIPCNSCRSDDSDKGFCIASLSRNGYVPVVLRIADRAQAEQILSRGRNNGTELELLRWSPEKGAFTLTS